MSTKDLVNAIIVGDAKAIEETFKLTLYTRITDRMGALREQIAKNMFKSTDQQIDEVLSKDASAGEWISDFVSSDNPKFAGKSKEKRKQMALAAYYAKQREK